MVKNFTGKAVIFWTGCRRHRAPIDRFDREIVPRNATLGVG